MAADPPRDLVQAAESVLDRHGWHGMTAELIAEAAGINRVTLYRRGHNAATLVTAAAAAAAAEFREGALGALSDGGTARHRLTLLLDALFDVADRHLALLALLYDGPTAVFHLTAGGSEAAVTRFEYTEPFERILRDGLADATLTTPDPSRDAELIFNVAGWTYVHMRRSHGQPADQARADLHRLIAALVDEVPART
jgi:AcrR family transcriptional regulator